MTIRYDLRDAFRQLRRSPGFTAAAVISLALGIGANTAIFTLLDQVLLRALPVDQPHQLVRLRLTGMRYGVTMGGDTFSYPAYREIRDQNQVFSGVLCRYRVPLSVGYEGQTERVAGELVSGNYFEVLRVGAAAGRTLTPEDDRLPGGHPLAMLSYDYWTERFGADSAVVGRTLVVNGQPLTVVGVGQKSFDGIRAGILAQALDSCGDESADDPGVVLRGSHTREPPHVLGAGAGAAQPRRHAGDGQSVTPAAISRHARAGTARARVRER